jgi:DNA-binding response OmpR family regulator
LRILSLEDDPYDTELIQALLDTDDIVCEVTRVDTQAAFLASLERGEVDLILADYTLPSFDGLSALKLAMSASPDVPFIFVSGTLGEEVAIEALKIGATDYVLKTRLSRLVPSVHRALRETSERAERKRAEEALRRSEAYLAEAQRLSRTGSCGWDVVSGEIYWSEETFRIFECEPSANASRRRNPRWIWSCSALIRKIGRASAGCSTAPRPNGAASILSIGCSCPMVPSNSFALWLIPRKTIALAVCSSSGR